MKNFEHFSVKTKRTFYTEEKIKNYEKNILLFDWAKKKKDQAVELAEVYLKHGTDKLLIYVTQQNLPRSYGVNQMKGCPVCGKGINKYGNYPYQTDLFNKPFKLTCPNCRSVFPSNDFDSYYKSGLDENGRFHYEKADPKFLVNELYPDKASDWCADNGFGWVDQESVKMKSCVPVCNKEEEIFEDKERIIGENRYTFIAYFNHWHIWYGGNNLITNAISAFSDAYLYTGEDKYAKAGIVLLNRAADFYREFDTDSYKWEDNFRHSGDRGKIVGSIWETFLIDNYTKAYDAFFPAIDEKACEVINEQLFYTNNPLAPKTPGDIKQNIENNILYQILPEVKNSRIHGNVGMHQGTIALAALVIDNEKYFNECIDFILNATGSLPDIDGDIACDLHGDINRILIECIDHDGCGNEISVSYNGLWLDTFSFIAGILKGTTRDLYKNIKFRKMFHLDIPYIVADRSSLNMGDEGRAGSPDALIHEKAALSLFEYNNDVKSAQLLELAARLRREKGASGNFLEEMFYDCEKIERDIKKVIEEKGRFISESKNYSGFGISKAEIRNEGEEPQSVWMYYGRNTGHGHFDTLMLGVYAYGVFLNPDHGYPSFCDGNHERRCWTKNTISHDTVVVDGKPGSRQIVGIPHHFYPGKLVSVMDIEAPLLYENTSCYRRSTMVVNIGGMPYIADFFRIAGGDDHRYVFHGAEGDAKSTGLKLVKQNAGTYAGEDIAAASAAYDETHKDGFDYLYEVQRDNNVKGSFTIDWKLKDTWHVWKEDRDIHMAITVIDPVDEAVLAKGQPPQNKPGNPKEFTYLIAHNKGKNIESQYASIIEAYENERNILKAEAVPIIDEKGAPVDYRAKALKITMKNGRIDYIINALDGKTYDIDVGGDDGCGADGKIKFRGFLGIISMKDGKIVYRCTNDVSFCKVGEEVIVAEGEGVAGKVVDFTKELAGENKIIAKIERDISPCKLPGAYIDIKTDLIRNGFYEIESAKLLDNGLYEISVGNTTFIRSYVDFKDSEKGYIYNISEGAPFTIALTDESFY